MDSDLVKSIMDNKRHKKIFIATYYRSSIRRYSNGSHKIILRFELDNKRVSSPRFF